MKLAVVAVAILVNIAAPKAKCADTVVMGTNTRNGGEGAGDRAAMQDIRDRFVYMPGSLRVHEDH